jgi:hypothetical protein
VRKHGTRVGRTCLTLGEGFQPAAAIVRREEKCRGHQVEAPAEISSRNAWQRSAQGAQVLARDRIEMERQQFGCALRVDQPHPGTQT